MRADRQFHTPAVIVAWRGVGELLHHPLETGVGLVLVRPNGHGPTHLIGMDHLVVPVGPLDQSHRYYPPKPSRPIDDPHGILLGSAKICLQRQTRRKIDLCTAPLEQFQCEIFHRVLFHIEVDQHVVLARG